MTATTLLTERMERFKEAGLYLVTSENMSAGRSTVDVVGQALSAGLQLVQLREKEMDARSLLATARRLRQLTTDAGALLIINDRVDIALACEADGVHLGQTDLPVAAARELAPDLIIGASSHSLAMAQEAEREGASYVNIGPIFPTETKQVQMDYLGVEAVRRIAPELTIPFTVMGGIKAHHIPELTAAGARLIALVTAVTAQPDPGRATAELLRTIREHSN